MQPQPAPSTNLSPKSRAILFHLKQSLKQKNLLLDTHISNIFEYRKQKFNRKQFQKLIRKYDQNLVLSEIDQLFKQLDQSGNKYVLYETLTKYLELIDEKDDPSQILNRKSVLLSEQELQQAFALIQVKNALVQNQQYLQLIQLFMTQKDGYLTKTNVKSLFENLQFNNEKKVNSAINTLFEGNDKIELKQFLKKLELDTDGTRIRLSDYSMDQSIILDVMKSQYIKKNQNSRLSRQINIQYSKILDSLNQPQNSLNSGVYAIQKIPKSIQKYFNYGSELQEPFAVLASNYLENSLVFIDQEGPTYGKAKKWIHIAEYNPNYFIFEAAQSIVYRAQERTGLAMLLEPRDITQGKFGNCYFLSALAAIVEVYPQLVYRLFVLQKNPSHIYGIRLFIDGTWKTVAVDGCFPVGEDGKFCGAQPHHSQIWVMLLEKAWAKIFKTFQNIHSGYNQEGLVAISGAPTIIILIKQKGFLQKVQDQFKKGSIITCTTAKHVSQMSIESQQKLGVFAGHAYTILRIYNDVEVKAQNKKIILLKMKNPWGTKSWKGDWSFNSNKWTKQLRIQFNYHIDTKDGTFFINIDDFVKYFDHINISKVNLGNRNSSVVNNANRYDFYLNPVTINQAGKYFFTIYQDNGRKYKGASGVYQKSPSWLFMAKIDFVNEKGEANLVSVACNASGYQHSTIQADLSPGQYVILSKVSWNYWQEHPYTITSYGPSKVVFEPCQIAQIDILNVFIRAHSQKIIRQNPSMITYYKQTKIWKSFYFDHTEGLGFIAISNDYLGKQQTKTIQTTLTLQPCKGIQVLAPFSNPLHIKVKPGETSVAGFIVDPQGYSYKLLEGYKLYLNK